MCDHLSPELTTDMAPVQQLNQQLRTTGRQRMGAKRLSTAKPAPTHRSGPEISAGRGGTDYGEGAELQGLQSLVGL